MKRIILLLISFIALTTTSAKMPDVMVLEDGYGLDSTIVSTDHQKYSYDEMMEDLDLLSLFFPQCVSYGTKGTTDQGRTIPIVYLGNVAAEKKIMVNVILLSIKL
mgnify:CR=1 FL=1